MSDLLLVVLVLLAGLSAGFANGCHNTKRSLRMALTFGTIFGAILGYALLIGEIGLLGAICMCLGTTTGTVLAAMLPNHNKIKRFFNRSKKRS